MSAPEQLRIVEPEPTGGDHEAARDREPGLAPPTPTPEQAAAIANRDRDVFLEAGAGTGKTGVLVQRYCDAVTVDDVPLDGILAFTFTDKAAGELRGRIRAELARRAAAAGEVDQDEERSQELWRLARDTERAWISTIHGFCHRVLAAHPVAAGLDPRFRVLDQAEGELVAESAFAAALEELAAGDPEVEALAAGFTIHRLRGLVVPTHEKLRSQGVERPVLPEMPDPRLPAPGADPDAEAPQLSDAEAAASTEAYRCLRELVAAFGRHYEALKVERSSLDFEDLQLRAVRLLRDRPAIAAGFRERFGHLMVDEFQDTNRLQLELMRLLRGPETRLFVVGDEFQSIYGFRNADLEVFRAERERAAEAPDGEVTVLPLRGNFRSTPAVLAAVNALGAALLEGFRPLAEGREADPEAGAEPAVELLLTEAKGWDAEGIDLRQLAGENTPAAKVAEARALAARLRALHDAGVPRSEMVVLIRAFTHVATYEEALERAGLAPYVVGGRGYWSHQQVEDMLRLLACVANPLADEALFGALACPAVAVSPDALWLLRQAARDERGYARHVWPALARGFGPAQPEEDSSDRGESDPPDPWIERIGAEDAAKLRRYCELLARLRSLAPTLSLEALVDRTARELGYDLAVLMRNRGTQRLANVRKLMRLARRFEAAEGRDLSAFLRYAEARGSRGDREGLAATEAEDHDGVRVMTIHAAKGLEFGVVAVPDLGRGLLAGVRWPALQLGQLAPPADGEASGNADAAARLGLRLPRPGQKAITLWEFQHLQDEAAAADGAEACRLVYVAATRARDRLLLSGTFTEKDLEDCEPRPSHSALRKLLRPLGFTGGERELEVEGGRIAISVSSPSPERAAELVRISNGRPPPATIAPGEPPPIVSPGSVTPAAGHLSYAALADFERCGYRFYVERVLGLGEPEPGGVPDLDDDGSADAEGREDARALGNAVHALLEWSARNRWAQPGPERCRGALRHDGLPGDERSTTRAAELVRGWLDSPLRRSLDAPGMRRRPEASFMLAISGSVVRGKMDLVAELPDGGLLVVDYKTDALGGARPQELIARYEAQRSLYALAASRGLAGDGEAVRVRTSYVFLERPGEPVERTFERDDLEAARAELEALVAGVRAGSFEVTANPHRALCHDCPARERLCTHPPERTMADTP